jgi:hypothetical protein
MHVGALSVFEGEPFFNDDRRFRLREARDLVASRLHLIPRFRKQIQSVPLDAGEPVWVDDPRFDIGYHVRLTALPAPGTRDQLLALFERVQRRCSAAPAAVDGSNPRPRGWPHRADPEDAPRSSTGSGVDVATVLLDFSGPRAPRWRDRPPPRGSSSTRSQASACPIARKRLRAAGPARRDRIASWRRSARSVRWHHRRTSLNHPVSVSRRFGLVRPTRRRQDTGERSAAPQRRRAAGWVVTGALLGAPSSSQARAEDLCQTIGARRQRAELSSRVSHVHPAACGEPAVARLYAVQARPRPQGPEQPWLTAAL